MTRDRGVSVTLNFVIMLAVATTVLVALLFGVSGVVDSQMNQAVDDELTVIAASFASELEHADRLQRSTAQSANLSVNVRLPTHVSGSSYHVVVNGSAQELRFISAQPQRSVTVAIDAPSVASEEHTVRGGPVEIVLVAGSLEVRST